jgi:two-component system response regulator CssR
VAEELAMTYSIYVVEDEQHLNEILSNYLVAEGWSVRSFIDGRSAQAAIAEAPHLWVLDIMLPDVDGYQLLREIKILTPDVPVIFISARDQGLDRILGLELGGEDYLAKPFMPRELVIRARNLLTRYYGQLSAVKTSQQRLGPYALDVQRRSVFFDEQDVECTSKEFDLLMFFVEHAGQAFAREQILLQVWGDDYFGSDRVVDDLIRRLRKKMPLLKLETIYGFGYRLVKQS